MNSLKPQPGEKRILQEDCAEDKMKNGILTLTSKRIVFQRTEGTMATLSKKTGDVLLDIPLERITSVRSEGFLVTKVVIVTTNNKTYKFGVFSTGKWTKEIENQIKVNRLSGSNSSSTK
jgi:hypothetical protein